MNFELTSPFMPTGDQPEAIAALTEGLRCGLPAQTLLGVTGSGKTFTVANVINEVQRPTLILSHNKTLAAQLYSEFKAFFPANAVEYFVSYYDYYQPEAYLPVTDTYIEKDLQINQEIDKLRLRATASLLSGRRDVIVVSSVSCLYGMADPTAFAERVIYLRKGMKLNRDVMLRMFVDALYVNNKVDFNSGSFRVNGDVVDVFPAIESFDGLAYRIEFWGDEIERISSFVPLTGKEAGEQDELNVYPTNLFVTTDEQVRIALLRIRQDLEQQERFLIQAGKTHEAKRLHERVSFDLEMIREIGYCSGVENYSRYFDGREAGDRPFCLLDYFPKDFLMVVDESHVTVPQIRAMYGGDRSRKQNLVEYGFRLPAALDNRPLTFDEFEAMTPSVLYVSATPADYELARSEGIVVDQVIRPTGLLDPPIDVRPTTHQIDDLMEEIALCSAAGERALVTTLTKRMAEELADYLLRMGVRCNYIHSDVETLERIQIMDDLRKGVFDVLIGVNLLREGLDLPEVSLVAILDADKEGFLRSRRSLTQTAGRAARNVNGRVIFYADKITDSMQLTIDETDRRREKQLAYNEQHGIVPRQVIKAGVSLLAERRQGEPLPYIEPKQEPLLVADPVVQYMNRPQLEKAVEHTRQLMADAAERLDFIEAAQYRDEWFRLKDLLQTLVLFLLLLLPSAVYAQSDTIYCTEEDHALFDRYRIALAGKDSLPFDSLILATASFFLGTPYVGATLEQEPEGLVINLRELDCFTFVENVIALSRTIAQGEPTFGKYCDHLRLVRYREGIITRYTDRLHYTSDWLYENNRKQIVRHPGEDTAGQPYTFNLHFMSSHPGSYRQLKADSSLVSVIKETEESINARTSHYYLIPAHDIDSLAARIHNGDVVAFVTTIPGLDISHVGIATRVGEMLTFIHASSLSKKVIVNKESLKEYAVNGKNCTGIMTARPLPPLPEQPCHEQSCRKLDADTLIWCP